MPIPVGDYIKKTGSITEFSAFTPGDLILVTGTINNNGVYTVKQIVDDGTNSYMTVSGGNLTTESGAASHNISVIRPYGDKLLALGDVDNGEVDIWSYNAEAVGSGWSTVAITPVINGSNAKFIYYFANEALRVCDINTSNTSIIKWYGYISTIQFDNASTGAVFSGYEEHPNYLPAPTAGDYYASATYTGIGQVDSNANIAENLDVSETEIDIDDVTKVYPGLVLQIGTSTEYVLVRKVVATSNVDNSGTMTVYRGYGGKTATTHTSGDSLFKMGLGFNIRITEDTLGGEWEAKIWEFAQTFIYDGKQESKIFVMSNTFDNSAGSGGKKLNVDIQANQLFPARVTGGRIYIRESGSSEPWVLLADIDVSKGARTSLDREYITWSFSGTVNNMTKWNVSNLDSDAPNLDTYETINGFSVDSQSIALGLTNERFQASVIANSRCFIANVAREVSIGENAFVDNFGDRICYSEVGKYDTFPSDNFIDVSKGDAEAYTHLEAYADRLLAFKQNTLHIINIANPSPVGWFLEKSMKFMGIRYPYNAVKTDFGIAWVNPQGCYLFDGSKVVNLINGKIKDNGDTYLETVNDTNTIWASNLKVLTWDKFVRGSSFNSEVNIGYHPKDKLLILHRSPSDGTTYSHITYIYDFGVKSWVLNDNMFTDSGQYTNFQIDWDSELIIGVKNGVSIDFKKWINAQSAQDEKVFITKDIDFDDPGSIKVIYAVYITYYSNTAIDDGNTDVPLQYAINGGVNWVNFDTSVVGGSSSSTNLAASGTGSGEYWDIAKFTLTTPITCQSIKLKMNANTSAILNINDIQIEFRIKPHQRIS